MNSTDPSIVALLMTDVVASTEIWRGQRAAADLLARQAAIVNAAIVACGGARPPDQGEGDSAFAVFKRPADAIAAALDAQRQLLAEPWPDNRRIDVRMAVHTGELERRESDNYGGLELIRCARLRALASGGQVLVSEATVALSRQRVPDGVTFVELATVTLPSFDRAERVFQLCHADLPGGLIPLRRSNVLLPSSPTTLIGRDRERQELAALLLRERMVTLTGAGGAGKTRLALAVATDLAGRFRDGAVWVELGALAAAEQSLSAVVTACGAREVPGVTAMDVLVRHLATREQLIVLDNCEHLLDVSASIASALAGACPDVRLLATSREPLGVPGETTWRVPSLALPAAAEADPLRIGESGAVQLFAARATAADASFAVDADNAALVSRICRRLDGIPLALELAAARVRALSLERLADGLDDRFRLLTGGARTVLARQRTLLASVEWSHALLDDDARVVFRRISVFSSPFALEAVEAIAADDDIGVDAVFDLLARLVDKSLVVRVGDRYRLLETLRQYALERAADADELAELRDRHLGWLTHRARGWHLDREVATWAVIQEITREAPDLIAAADWASSRGEAPTPILCALRDYWDAGGNIAEALATWQRITGALEAGTRPWFEAMAVTGMRGNMEWFGPARTALAETTIELDVETRAWLEVNTTVLPALFGHPAALDTLRRSADVGRRCGNRKIEAAALGVYGMALAFGGNVAQARALLPMLRRCVTPDTPQYDSYEVVAAFVEVAEGNLRTARVRVERALERNDRLALLTTIGSLVAMWCNDADLLQRMLRHFQCLPVAGVTVGAIDVIQARLHLVLDDLEPAGERFERASERSLTFEGGAALHAARLGEVRLALGDVAGAQVQLGAMRTSAVGTEHYLLRVTAELLAALIEHARGNDRDAQSNAYAALKIASERGLSIAETDALEVIALLAAERGVVDDAAWILGGAAAFRDRSGYRWRSHYLHRAITALESTLPPAAVARGTAATLDEVVAFALRGRGDRGRPDHGWESLTPSEWRVVELVAEGLANAAVAKRLHVSLATVKTHLVHVYGKLGMESRAELAAAAATRRSSRPDTAT